MSRTLRMTEEQYAARKKPVDLPEEWRPVSINAGKYVSRYEVSSLGRVRASPTCKIPGSKPGRILAVRPEKVSGYLEVSLYSEGKNHRVKVHRLVATAFLGNRPLNLTVNHKDSDKTNNCLVNLEYVTCQENVDHGNFHSGRSRHIVNGEEMSMPQACKRFGAKGVSPKIALQRMNRNGWSAEKAITTPVLGIGRQKYGNMKTDGYASKKERCRAAELKMLALAGQIRNLREQVSYELIPRQCIGGKLVERECRYVADWTYEELQSGLWVPVVEDAKSPATKTPVYRLKKKLLLWVYGIVLRET